MDDAIHRWEVEAKQWATLDGEYRRLDDLTKTVLGELVNHSEDKAIYDLGSAAHNMVLRQDCWREEIEVIDAPNYSSKVAKQARDAARADGRHPVLGHIWTRSPAWPDATGRHRNKLGILRRIELTSMKALASSEIVLGGGNFRTIILLSLLH